MVFVWRTRRPQGAEEREGGRGRASWPPSAVRGTDRMNDIYTSSSRSPTPESQLARPDPASERVDQPGIENARLVDGSSDQPAPFGPATRRTDASSHVLNGLVQDCAAAGPPKGELEVEAPTCALSAQRPSTCPSPCPSAECYRSVDSSHSQDPACCVLPAVEGPPNLPDAMVPAGAPSDAACVPGSDHGGSSAFISPGQAGWGEPCMFLPSVGWSSSTAHAPVPHQSPGPDGPGGRQDDGTEAYALTGHAARRPIAEGLGDPSNGSGATAGCPPAVPSVGAAYYHPQCFLGQPQAAVCTPIPASASPWIQPYAPTGYGYEGLGDPGNGYGTTAGCPPAASSMGATYYHPQGFLGHPQAAVCTPFPASASPWIQPYAPTLLQRATGTWSRVTYQPMPARWSLSAALTGLTFSACTPPKHHQLQSQPGYVAKFRTT